jgi:hypothetical protein
VKKIFLFFLSCCLASCSTEPSKNSQSLSDADLLAIKEVLSRQETAWNAGSIEEFMEGYWKSDSLQFVGSKITRGWQQTLDRYKASYPDRATMGTLKFEFFRFYLVAPDVCVITGRYTLTRDKDMPNGLFTLLMRKMSGKWVIIYDHTS